MSLSDVRANIDRVDKEIRKLFMERMILANRVAEIKSKTEDSINKPEREKEIIEKQTQGVEEKFVKEYTALIKRIMEVSRKYQYGRTLQLRDCFPFSFQTEFYPITKIAMIKPELYLCQKISKDEVMAVDSYDEISKLLEESKVDAGMGVIEEIGVGVSDELHRILHENNYYINECEIIEEKGVRKKIVTFSKNLVVLPEHTLLKIVFECPNKDGSLSSILSMISDYGVNLTEIHSRPFKKEDQWNYHFFAELNANMAKDEMKALLFQLSQETSNLQILGSY